MNFSSQTNQPAPVQSLLKINTGSLLDSLDTETQARVLEQRFIKQPLVIAENPYQKMLQKLLADRSYFDIEFGHFIRTKITQGYYRARSITDNNYKLMGGKNQYRYTIIALNNFKNLETHLICLWFFGRLPKPGEEIDHISGDIQNNKLDNLRLVTRLINCRNVAKHKRNTSGYTGIDLTTNTGRNKWRARCKGVHIGLFNTIEEAVKARQEWIAARPELRFTTRHGT